MKRFFQVFAAVAVLGAITSCSNDNTQTGSNGQTTATFYQLDRLGKGSNAYLFIPWASRTANNSGTPTTDVTTMRGQIATFMEGPLAGRSAATTSYASFILAPDVLYADFSVYNVGASYLGIETGGKLNKDGTVCGVAAEACTGTKFGGRDLSDDIWASDLGLVFGNTVSLISTLAPCPNPVGVAPCPVADDGKEQNGTGGKPNLANDNVPGNNLTISVTFPFLPAAR